MIKKVEGIIISTVDYKESSRIVNILTKNDGVLGVLAKGCKNIKSKLSTTSTALVYGNFYLRQYGNGIPLLMEVDVIDSFKEIRKDIVKLNYSLFLLELCGQVYKHKNDEQIYSLLIEGLIKINKDYNPQVITQILELKFLYYLGIKPIIDKCVVCGNKEDIVTISSYKGGFLCKNCVEHEFLYNIKTIKLIRCFYMIDLSKISKIEISDEIKRELSLFIDDYYERYSGLYLKSKTFLEKFSKINS